MYYVLFSHERLINNIELFINRTSQEELRQYYGSQEKTVTGLKIGENYAREFMPNTNHNDISNSTKSVLANPRQDDTLDGLYGLISTDWCIYIHGALMAGLFTFALLR